jgi:hypothetical protein
MINKFLTYLRNKFIPKYPQPGEVWGFEHDDPFNSLDVCILEYQDGYIKYYFVDRAEKDGVTVSKSDKVSYRIHKPNHPHLEWRKNNTVKLLN